MTSARRAVRGGRRGALPRSAALWCCLAALALALVASACSASSSGDDGPCLSVPLPQPHALGRPHHHRARERRPPGQAAPRHHGDRPRRDARLGDREERRRARRRQARRLGDRVAEPLDAGDRQAVRRARHRRRRRGPHHHQDEQVPHAGPRHHRQRPDLPGPQRHLRRRHAGDAVLQQPRGGQEGGRARARPQELAPGRGRLVLGRRPGALVPPARLLAAEHQGELRRPPRRRAALPRRLRHAHACGRTSGSGAR